MVTQERLKRLFNYDPATGEFTRAVSVRGARPSVGSLQKNGYVTVCVDSKTYLYHRLVWVWNTGTEPPDQIDHINGNRSDNRFSNLRLATSRQNHENKHHVRTRTGARGVTVDVRTGRFIARIGIARRTYHIGVFDTVEEAAIAAKQARDQLFTHHTS